MFYLSINICFFISLLIFALFLSNLLINFNLITNIFLDCKPVKEQFHKLFNIFRHKKCHSFEIIFFIKFRVVIQNEDIYEIYYITNRLLFHSKQRLLLLLLLLSFFIKLFFIEVLLLFILSNNGFLIFGLIDQLWLFILLLLLFIFLNVIRRGFLFR
jgi:hypothetical protein